MSESPDAVLPTITATPHEAAPGDHIGPYKLLQRIGEGGMGTVWQAEQTDPVRRLVAVKLVKPGMDSGEVLARFEAERQALALMDHPSIAKVLDAGTTAAGRPYFAMELVKGLPITKYCDDARLTLRERIELFISVCHAVQHAHQKGIIHRDLKPSNVLVALYDGKPVPKVIDFGVAKALHQPLTERTLVTQLGMLMGTPEYMAPEQAEVNALDIDTRADVYSLGVILYELLTGTTPIDRRQLKQGALLELVRLIREVEPPTPSKKLTSIDTLADTAARRRTEPKQLGRLIRGDLDWIVMKCLDKERSRRYETASGLAMDLGYHLHDEPVSAGRPSKTYRVKKFIWRNKAPVLTAAAVFLSLLVGTVISAYFAIQADARAREADKNAAAALREKQRADDKAAEADAKAADALREKQRADDKAAEVRVSEQHAMGRLYISDMRLAQRAEDEAQFPRLVELLEGQRPERTGGIDQRGFEWYYLWRCCHSDLLTLKGHRGGLSRAAYSPDGKWIASASLDKTIKIWDAATGQEFLTLKGHTNSVLSLAYSPDGKWIASASLDKTIKIWDAATGQEFLTLKGHTNFVLSLAYSPDGKRIVGSFDKTIRILDAATLQETLTLKGHTDPVFSVAYSPDGKRIVSGSNFGTVKVWDATTGKTTLTLKGHNQPVTSVAYRPDSKRIVSGSFDSTIKVWEPATGQEILTLKGHSRPVMSVAYSPDGKRIVSGSDDKTIKIWDAAAGQETLTLKGHIGPAVTVAYSPDGNRIVSGSQDGTIKVWDATTGKTTLTLKGHNQPVTSVAYRPDSKRIVSGSFDSTIKVWEPATGQETLTLKGHTGPVSSVAYSPDGKRIVSGGCDKTIKIWDAATGKEALTLKGHTDTVLSLAYSPDSKRIVSGSFDKTIKIWDARTGKEALTLKGHASVRISVIDMPVVRAVASVYSPDGKHIVSGSYENTVKVWDAGTGQETLTLKGHIGPAVSVAYSPDGKRIVSGSYDNTVKVWDATTGQGILTLKGHSRPVMSVAYSPDGKRIVSGSQDGTIKVWDATPMEDKLPLAAGPAEE